MRPGELASRLLEVLGARAVVEEVLPAAPDVDEREVGTPGPWHGWELPGRREVYGWLRYDAHLAARLALVELLGPQVGGALLERAEQLEPRRPPVGTRASRAVLDGDAAAASRAAAEALEGRVGHGRRGPATYRNMTEGEMAAVALRAIALARVTEAERRNS